MRSYIIFAVLHLTCSLNNSVLRLIDGTADDFEVASDISWSYDEPTEIQR